MARLYRPRKHPTAQKNWHVAAPVLDFKKKTNKSIVKFQKKTYFCKTKQRYVENV